MNMNLKNNLLCMFLIVITYGCVTTTQTSKENTSPSPLTHGNVQLTLEKDVTTQQEVLETFGPPNIMTHDGDGNEVWTYQKNATMTKSNASGAYGLIMPLAPVYPANYLNLVTKMY